MLFNSLQFLLFFPTVTLAYFMLPHRYRYLHLLCASCLFYCAFIPYYVLILAFTIVIDYAAGIMIHNAHSDVSRKSFLTLSVIANAGVLVIFKYYNFFIDNANTLVSLLGGSQQSLHHFDMILPIGLSFHTFQAMSYTIEVYRRNQVAERNFLVYALYVMFYPQLVAGPIERPQNLLHQFREKHEFDYRRVTQGVKLMFWGLFKKVVIADRLAVIVDPVFSNPYDFPGIILMIAAICFSFQIFYDFSGYSDIAVGAAQVMGFRLMTNFEKPYYSVSIPEFWTRWHISLSTWFRDYLYIPLGGNRVSMPRWHLNVMLVFLVSGFWHGASWTFILWGGLHGLFFICTRITRRLRSRLIEVTRINRLPRVHTFLGILTTFTLATVAWVFFRANSIADALYIVTHFADGLLYNVQHLLATGHLGLNVAIPKRELFLALFFIAILEVVQEAGRKWNLTAFVQSRPIAIRWTFYYAAVAAIIGYGVFENRQFIYFQF